MLKVRRVEYLDGYKLKLFFSNGRVKVVDFEKWVFEKNQYLKPLRDLEFFKKVSLDEANYSICWPNGADFCPDVLYEMGTSVRLKRNRPKKIKPSTRSRKSLLRD